MIFVIIAYTIINSLVYDMIMSILFNNNERTDKCKICNRAYILVILKNKRLRRSNNPLYLLLSISDLIVAVSLTVIYGIQITEYLNNTSTRIASIWSLVVHSFVNMSISAIILIQLELYLAVFKPFAYKTILRKKTLPILLILAWIPSIIMPSVIFFNKSIFQDIVRTAITVYEFFSLLLVAFCQKKVIKYIRKNDHTRRGRKLSQVAAQILVVYGVSAVAGFVGSIVNQFNLATQVINDSVYEWCMFAVLTNTLWDTCIYGLRYVVVRNELLKVFPCFRICAKSSKNKVANFAEPLPWNQMRRNGVRK
ncbi:melatonin receptor type 1C-like [Hydractinia symbiolongicarpus]|uniref:melatonin receptor type 1C-like n=1 Tax=Hydractinia symbiolongicarpus TaxID=13093 RepID=UPI002550FD49|nr:melatonin receptor type 1C-like [Hydractinia symbiolongicarpus]